MADIWLTRNAVQLLQGKKLYFIGDSNVRALYKDVICLLNHNRLLSAKQLKAKAEAHFLGDDLLRGSPLTRGRAYREDRRYKRNNLHVEFHFVTKCLNEDIESMMKDFRTRRISAPDIIVMNSTQWDVNRWGPHGVDIFKENMVRLMNLFKESLPPSTLVIWVTAPPLSVEIRGGYMIKQLEFARFTMRFHVMEANLFAKELMSQFGYNCLDFHFHLQWQVHWRSPDGIHWSSKSMRYLGNLLLTHIALALRVPLPGNYFTEGLAKHKALARERPPPTAATASSRAASALMPAPAQPAPRGQNQQRQPVHMRLGRRQRQNPNQQFHRQVIQQPPQQRQQQQQQHHNNNHHHQQQEAYWGGAPLPNYPAPALPPLPPGPEPEYFANDSGYYTQDDTFVDNGSFFTSEPQQIQSLWGPVRRQGPSRRQRPY